MLNSYRLATTNIGVLLLDNVNVRRWLCLDDAIDGAREALREGSLDWDSLSDLISLSSSIGIAEENIGPGAGDAERLWGSPRESIKGVLEV